MNNLKKRVNGLNSLILKGQAMKAFEKYYDHDIVMQENNNPPVKGKADNREKEKELMEAIERFHNAEVKALAIENDVTMVEWVFDATFKGHGRGKINEVTVQRWKKGRIIHEKFYYDNSGAN